MAVTARLIRGDTASLELQALVGGQPINLTGLTVQFTARYDPGGSEVAISKSTATSGIIVTDAANGWLRVTIEAADTEALPNRPLFLYFDVEVSDMVGHRFTVEMGVLEYRSDISTDHL